jgi:hypothetical protein
LRPTKEIPQEKPACITTVGWLWKRNHMLRLAVHAQPIEARDEVKEKLIKSVGATSIQKKRKKTGNPKSM